MWGLYGVGWVPGVLALTVSGGFASLLCVLCVYDMRRKEAAEDSTY
jgi:hypothetical protein